MIVEYDPDFVKKLKEVDVGIRKNFSERIDILKKNPHEEQLNNHPLKREYTGLRSIDITADYRQYMKK